MKRRMLVAAICLSAATAVAKDLPPPRADTPRKSDAACAYLGEGYAKLAGSDTCVKVGGSVRVEGQAVFRR